MRIPWHQVAHESIHRILIATLTIVLARLIISIKLCSLKAMHLGAAGTS